MQDQLLSLLVGRRGHFAMESGYHSDHGYNLDTLFAQPDRLRPIVAALARQLARHHVQAVCGPETGGAKLAAMLARELGVECFYTERVTRTKVSGLFPTKYKLPAANRGAVRGQVIAIVDDAISAGSAVRGTLDSVRAAGAEAVVIGALFVFGDAFLPFARQQGLPLEKITSLPLGMWTPAECPLCRAGVELEDIPAQARD